MKIKGHLHVINSRADLYGNCYWAFSYTDHETGNTVQGSLGGSARGNASCAMQYLHGEYGHTNQTSEELPIRQFNRLTKEWSYIGGVEEIAQWITDSLKKKTEG